MYCTKCGNQIADTDKFCAKCGVVVKPVAAQKPKSRIAAAVYAFFFGHLGAHQFYLGHTTSGVIRLVITVFLGIFGAWLLTWSLAIVEGIIYLCRNDASFNKIYVEGKRPLF